MTERAAQIAVLGRGLGPSQFQSILPGQLGRIEAAIVYENSAVVLDTEFNGKMVVPVKSIIFANEWEVDDGK